VKLANDSVSTIRSIQYTGLDRDVIERPSLSDLASDNCFVTDGSNLWRTHILLDIL